MLHLVYYLLQALVPLSVLVAFWQLVRRRSAFTVLDNIPGPPGASWISGSIRELFNADAWEFHETIARTYGGVVRVKGAFGSNDLYVFDPDVIQHVLVKDHKCFEEPVWFTHGNRTVFGECLLIMHGNPHRRLRKMLNPLFSSAHLRQLVPTFYDVASKVQKSLFDIALKGPTEIDFLSWTTRLSLELFGQAGLGYSFNDLTENALEHPYERASKKFIGSYSQDPFLRTIVIPNIARLATPRVWKFVIDRTPLSAVQDMRQVIQTMHDTALEILNSKKIVKSGEESVDASIGKGKDIISTLLKANTAASAAERLTDDEVTSQINLLMYAASDTTSNSLCRIMYILATHKAEQSRLREEIRNARQNYEGDDFSDLIISLPYLDAILKETLRLYAPVPTTSRTAQRDTVLPLATPIKSTKGEEIREIPLPKGTNIIVSLLGSNRNPAVWGPDVHEWKPERWLRPLPESVINARIPGVYSHLMTFVAGVKSCLGFKFAELEMKVVLALLLENLEFSPSSKEIFWQMNLVTQPNTDPKGVVPTLPMVISVVK